ncbi:FAD/NAD(P)-binding domain-containing protein [Microbacterium sp. Marseille-Q6965]|uniref:FAD/NAD(P)-binding protein n=1 Tax=Microbacterium sp. Marseille-Q6965 TaxID=2965072 RepID=UPI0021B7451B|nr:FAD/NAD(P)-binding protein [Microbacterium sp. Marseille-Q6965]
MTSLAIVGGGPRGLSVLERLGAGLGREPHEDLELVLYERGAPGAGRVWDPDQPRELLMNTRAGEATIFADETVPVSLPRRHGPTLLQWAQRVAGAAGWDGEWAWLAPPASSDVAADLREVCARLAPMDFPPRALYGAYLVWAYRAVRAALPAGVAVRHLARRVVDVRDLGECAVVVDEDGGETIAEAVVLALGWLDAEHPRPVDPRWVAPDNPLDQPLDAIEPGEAVLLTGLGMSLFDNVARLTEGRGGVFSPRPDGTLAYTASGREPRMLVGSRSGRPYWPKPELRTAAAPPSRRFLNAVLARDGVLDFDHDVWPALVADAAAAHLSTLREHDPDALRPGADVDGAFDALLSHGPRAASGLAAFAEQVLREPLRGLAAADLLDEDPVAPAGAAWLHARYRRMAEEAERGEGSPLLRALTSFSGGRARLAGPLAAGRITAASRASGYRRYHAIARRLGGGPPLVRVRQLLALVESGHVQLLGPGVAADRRGAGFRVRDVTGERGTVSHVVESWMHHPTIARTADPLLRALRDRGSARAFTARDETGAAPSDALHVDPRDGALIAADGGRSRTIRSVGIPSDEQIGHSIVSPVPRTASRFLQETDAAARGSLHAAAQIGAPA